MNKSYKSNFNARLMLAVGLGVGLASLGATRVVGADPIFNDRNHTRSMFSPKAKPTRDIQTFLWSMMEGKGI